MYLCSCVSVVIHDYWCYIPPTSDNDSLIRDHLLSSVAKIESEFRSCGILLDGDFNRLNINFLLKHFRLKQLVKVLSSNNAALDLLLTNCMSITILLEQFLFLTTTPLWSHSKLKIAIPIGKRQCLNEIVGQATEHWVSILVEHNCETKWNIFHDVVDLDLLIPTKEI